MKTSVPDGATFEVVWGVAHSTRPGEVTEVGLYLGTAADLSTAAARDSRDFFTQATTAGAPAMDPAHTRTTCTRTGTVVKCAVFASSGVTIPVGAATLTFRACNSYVLDATSEVCDTRAVTMTFP